MVQSNQHFRLNDTVEVNVIHANMPSGGKRGKRTDLSLERYLEKKKSVISIRNNDNLCMARALVVAKSKIGNDPQVKSIVDHRGTMQTRLAQEQQQHYLQRSRQRQEDLLVHAQQPLRCDYKNAGVFCPQLLFPYL